MASQNRLRPADFQRVAVAAKRGAGENQGENSPPSPTLSADTAAMTAPPAAGKLVDRLFANLKAYFPAWKQAFETEADYNETKQIWLKTLIAQGVCNAPALKRGLAQAANSTNPFFPSVGQFVAWCRTEDYPALGLPNLADLSERWRKYLGYAQFDTACFDYRSRAEYWLLCELYRRCWNKPEEVLEGVMRKLLAEAAEKVKAGFVFPDIPLQVAVKPRQINRSNNLKHIARIKAMLGVK